MNKRKGIGDPFEARFGTIPPQVTVCGGEAWLPPTNIVVNHCYKRCVKLSSKACVSSTRNGRYERKLYKIVTHNRNERSAGGERRARPRRYRLCLPMIPSEARTGPGTPKPGSPIVTHECDAATIEHPLTRSPQGAILRQAQILGSRNSGRLSRAAFVSVVEFSNFW